MIVALPSLTVAAGNHSDVVIPEYKERFILSIGVVIYDKASNIQMKLMHGSVYNRYDQLISGLNFPNSQFYIPKGLRAQNLLISAYNGGADQVSLNFIVEYSETMKNLYVVN